MSANSAALSSARSSLRILHSHEPARQAVQCGDAAAPGESTRHTYCHWLESVRNSEETLSNDLPLALTLAPLYGLAALSRRPGSPFLRRTRSCAGTHRHPDA